MKMCVFEDTGVLNLQPLALTRPAFDLRCGATSLLEKQQRFFGCHTGALVRPELADLCRMQHPGLRVNDPSWLEGDEEFVALVNARWLAPAGRFSFSGQPEVGLVGEQAAWVVLPARQARSLSLDNLPRHLERRRQAGGAMMAYPWDLMEHNARALEEDFQHVAASGPLAGWEKRASGPLAATLIGPAERLRVDPAAVVEPMVVIDTTKGPVTIERGAVVQAFSHIEGPCYVGPDTHLLAARVKGSSFGPQCRVGGEVEASIIHGHGNKAHDGFLGHSYLGEWVNFGAGTHTSDLRTDYATVRFVLNGQKVDSGQMKVGSFVGDHTKTSLSALLNTGSLIGPFGLLLTSGTLLPRVLPPFCEVAHGRIQERNDLRGMFATAATMMARRGQEWTAEHAELAFFLYEATAAQRRQALREGEQRRLRRVI
jgi:UDP-N-acetylglucosamine diphosphorylase / glucose-1-phosphate thymidylyltransferase / UDP-N-acetylgalactosamine diphosphorylase / glucosamine-1-phosphate N-acetyltransferase / galactosamine-1-phosphate N-acetyltransferase